MAPFDATLTTKLSPLIDGQVPDFVQADHPKFVEFIKQYYEFLEAALIIVEGDIDNIIMESSVTQNIILDVDDDTSPKLMAEVGAGSTAAFNKGETITGSTSKATATILIDDLEQSAKKLIITSNQKFKLGETITGSISGATGTILTYQANPIQNMQQLLDYHDPDNTVTVFLDKMQEQFMHTIPQTLASGTSKRDLIKNIRDLYAAKGTAEGHKLFMRLMFDEEAEVRYPNKYMLRLSDGNWQKRNFLRAIATNGSRGSEIVGQNITGATSGATAFVEGASAFSQGTDAISEFDVSEIVGSFINGETISAVSINEQSDGLYREMSFTIQQIVTGATVNSGGSLYSENDIVTLDSSFGNGSSVVRVDQVGVGGISEVIIDDAGSGYRVGDALTFTTTDVSTSAAEGFVSTVGGSFLLENTVDNDDYIAQETGTIRSLIYNQLVLNGTDVLEANAGEEILLEGTDGSSTDAGSYILEERSILTLEDYSLESDRIVLEEGSLSSSEVGAITRIFITSAGSGYVSLPIVTVTSAHGSGAKLMSASNDIGQIKSVKIIDAGFRYSIEPPASVPVNFILKDITGSFNKEEALTGTYTGTVKAYDSTTQQLSVDLEDVVRTKLEQNNPSLQYDISLEREEDHFQRVQLNNFIDINDDNIGDNILTEGRIEPSVKIITDAVENGMEQISLEDSSTASKSMAVSLEEQRDDGDTYIQNEATDRVTQHRFLRATVDAGNHHNIILDGTAVGDSILLNGTDAGGTDIGDEILLDRTTAGGADAGDKLLQQNICEGYSLLFEDEPLVSNIQTRKDYMMLETGSGRKQYLTPGGWLDEARFDALPQPRTLGGRTTFIPETNLTSSVVTTYRGGTDVDLNDGEAILLEDGEYLVIDGLDSSIQAVERRGDSIRAYRGLDRLSFRTGEGERILLQGRPSQIVPDITGQGEVERYVEVGKFLLNATESTGDNAGDAIILEGPEWGASTDANGYYTFLENETVAHGGDSADRLITESGEGLVKEGSYDTPGLAFGSGSPLILNAHISDQEVESNFITINQTGGSGGDEDSYIINESSSSLIRQESGGDTEDVSLGDMIKTEPEDATTGNIILNGTDDTAANVGENIINEEGIIFKNTTIQGDSGGSATIAFGSSADLEMVVGFLGTSPGIYSNVDSIIDEDVIRIQDSYYYQDFSYELKIGESVSTYIEELKRAVHPAGFQPFGKVSFASLISATIPTAGAGRVDTATVTYSPMLASVLEELFEFRIKRRLNIPEQYVGGAYFEEIVQEVGDGEGSLLLDGTNFGIELEDFLLDVTGVDVGVVSLESGADDGDNIMLDYDIDTSNLLLTEIGDNIVLNRTGTSNQDEGDNIDLQDAGYAIEHVVNDNLITDGIDGLILLNAIQPDGAGAGFSIILNGTDASSTNDGDRILSDTASEISSSTNLVLNATDYTFNTGRAPNIVNEDPADVGSSLLTTAYEVDGNLVQVGDTFVLENATGDNIVLESGIQGGGVLMSERSAAAHSTTRDVNFIKILESSIALPQPRPVTGFGLPNMATPFSSAVSEGSIQLEDGLRKRGPTINTSVLLFDGHVGPSDAGFILETLDNTRRTTFDSTYNWLHTIAKPPQHWAGQSFDLELATNINIGAGLRFKDYTRYRNDNFVLDGTDASFSNAGDNVLAEDIPGGKLKTEDVGLTSNTMLDFIRPDHLLAENNDLGFGSFLILDGSDNTHNRVLNSGSRILTEEEDFIRYEEVAGNGVSEDDDKDVGFLLEAGMDDGAFIVESQIVYITQETAGAGLLLEETDGDKLLGESEVAGLNLLLEKGTGVSSGGKLLLDFVRIEAENSCSIGTIPPANYFDSTYFPDYALPAEFGTRPTGFVRLQDNRDPFFFTLNGTTALEANAGDNIVLNQTDTDGTDDGDKIESERFLYLPNQLDGYVQLNGTDGSSTNAGEYLQWERGTYTSLIGTSAPFLPANAEAETFDNTSKTTLDSTQQSYDVLEGF